jgi:hypothetical protein
MPRAPMACGPLTMRRQVRTGIRQSIPPAARRVAPPTAPPHHRLPTAVLLQALGKQAQSLAVPPQDLDQPATETAEDKDLPAKRIVLNLDSGMPFLL